MGPNLRVLHEKEIPQVLHEFHEGSCGWHLGGRFLVEHATTQGYLVAQNEEVSQGVREKV